MTSGMFYMVSIIRLLDICYGTLKHVRIGCNDIYCMFVLFSLCGHNLVGCVDRCIVHQQSQTLFPCHSWPIEVVIPAQFYSIHGVLWSPCQCYSNGSFHHGKYQGCCFQLWLLLRIPVGVPSMVWQVQLFKHEFHIEHWNLNRTGDSWWQSGNGNGPWNDPVLSSTEHPTPIYVPRGALWHHHQAIFSPTLHLLYCSWAS